MGFQRRSQRPDGVLLLDVLGENIPVSMERLARGGRSHQTDSKVSRAMRWTAYNYSIDIRWRRSPNRPWLKDVKDNAMDSMYGKTRNSRTNVPFLPPRLLAVTDNAVNSMCGETISKRTRRSPNTLQAVMGSTNRP